MRASRALPLALLGLVILGLGVRGGVTPSGAACLGLAIGALGLVAAGSRGWPSAPAAGPILALAWPGLAALSLLWSPDTDAALRGVAAAASVAVVWLLGLGLTAREARRRFAVGLSVMGAVAAAAAVAATPAGARAAFPLGNPNHLAAWLLLPAGLSATALLASDPRVRGMRESAFLWFGVVAVTGAGVAATSSRGVGLAAAAAVAGLAVLRAVGVRRGAPLLAAGGFAAALLLGAAAVLAPDVLEPHRAGGESSAGLRWSVYAAAGRAALDAAPLGAGLGSFGNVFAAHRPEGIAYAARFAHSEPLHGLVELGLPFAALCIATAVVLARALARALPSRGGRVRWGATAGLLGLAAHSLVDFPLHVPLIAITAAALAAVAVGRAAPHRSPVPARAALALLSTALVVAAGTDALALRAERRAEAHLAAGDAASALAWADTGLRWRPRRASLRRVAADAAEHAFRFEGAGRDALARALEERSRAVAADPRDARLRRERARTRLAVGDLQGARRDLEEAERHDPRSPVAPLARARLALREGAPERAVAEVRSALERHPAAVALALAALLADTGDPVLVRAAAPSADGAQRAAATLLARAGHAREAAGVLAGLAAREDGDPDLALRAAALYRHAGAPARAASVLAAAVRRWPTDPRLERALAAVPPAREAAR